MKIDVSVGRMATVASDGTLTFGPVTSVTPMRYLNHFRRWLYYPRPRHVSKRGPWWQRPRWVMSRRQRRRLRAKLRRPWSET